MAQERRQESFFLRAWLGVEKRRRKGGSEQGRLRQKILVEKQKKISVMHSNLEVERARRRKEGKETGKKSDFFWLY